MIGQGWDALVAFGGNHENVPPAGTGLLNLADHFFMPGVLGGNG